jgi:hypothetical protein
MSGEFVFAFMVLDLTLGGLGCIIMGGLAALHGVLHWKDLIPTRKELLLYRSRQYTIVTR